MAACGDATGGTPAAAASTAPNGDVVNPVDVAFAQELLPHHADALVMVDLTLGRDLDPRVADLVERLRAEHSAQVETMSGWLTSWGDQVPETARDHADARAAEDEAADGDVGPARDLAAEVVDTQEGETEQMQALLEELGG